MAVATPSTMEPAEAAHRAHRHQPAHRDQSCTIAYDAQANPVYGFGPRACVQPNDVVSGDRIIGRDPNPFIRGQLLRAYNSGYPD